MSSVIDPHPEPPAAEELVAYLDGELPPDDCRLVEQRLAADADYRQQLRDLDQAWEALDVLPTPKAHDDFARTTMELVAVAAQSDASSVTTTAAGAKRRRMAWFAAAALAGVLLGFIVARLLLPNQNRDLLSDLPVIRRAETLRQVESAEFLRRLAEKVPAERLMHDEHELLNEMVQMAAMRSPSMETRRTWVDGLSAEEKVALAAEAKRFTGLKPAPATQDALRALDQDINAGGETLQRTLLAYEQWLSQLTAGQQEELRVELMERTVDEQVKLIGRLVREEQEQASRQPTDQDANTLRKALGEFATERQAELDALRRRRGDGDRPRRNEGGVATILARALMRNDEEGQRVRGQLTENLSPDAKAHLDSLSGWRSNAQLWRWIRESFEEKVDSNELERFFVGTLNNQQRERLLSLPPNEMQTRLERLYYATELGYGDAAEWMSQLHDEGRWPPNRPGPGGPGFRPEGPPPRERDGPRNFMERELMRPGPRGPGGPPRPGAEDSRDGRPFGPPPDGPR